MYSAKGKVKSLKWDLNTSHVYVWYPTTNDERTLNSGEKKYSEMCLICLMESERIWWARLQSICHSKGTAVFTQMLYKYIKVLFSRTLQLDRSLTSRSGSGFSSSSSNHVTVTNLSLSVTRPSPFSNLKSGVAAYPILPFHYWTGCVWGKS